MKLNELRINVSLKSDKPTDLGNWCGSQIRGALKNGIAMRCCTSLCYNGCSNCRKLGCVSKKLFDSKPTITSKSIVNHASHFSNPIIVESEFSDTAVESDTIRITIRLFGSEAIEQKDILMDIMKDGLFTGYPRVKFVATDISETTHEYDLDMLGDKDASANNKKFKLVFDTPYIKRSKHDFSSDQLIRAVTSRVTSIVNGVGLDYEVPFREAFKDAESINIEDVDTKDVYYGRHSTHKKRSEVIHGLTGSITMSGSFVNSMNFFKMCEKLGLGAECTFGFGRFHLEEVK